MKKEATLVLRDQLSEVLLELNWSMPEDKNLEEVELNSSKEDVTVRVPTSRLMLLNPNNFFEPADMTEKRRDTEAKRKHGST